MNEYHPINEEAWAEWVEFRTVEKRKKIGPIAEKKQRKMLSQYPPPIQQGIIDHSIMNSYQGLFPPKDSGNGRFPRTTQTGSSPKPTHADTLRARLADLEAGT